MLTRSFEESFITECSHNHGFWSQRSSFVARLTTEAIIIRWTLNHRNNNALDVVLQKNPDTRRFITKWSFLGLLVTKRTIFDARTQKQSPKCSSAICLVTEKLVCKLIDRGVVYCSTVVLVTDARLRRGCQTRGGGRVLAICTRHSLAAESVLCYHSRLPLYQSVVEGQKLPPPL